MGGFSRLYVFLYNNIKYIVKYFRLLQKHNIQSSFSSSNSYNSMLSSLSILSFPIKIPMFAYFSLMFTFKLIIYSLVIQFIFNNPSKHLKFLFKSFFRLLIQNLYSPSNPLYEPLMRLFQYVTFYFPLSNLNLSFEILLKNHTNY